MTSNSKIKKYVYTNQDGSLVSVPGLYIDEKTGTFIARAYDSGTTRSKSLKTKSFPIAKNRVTAAIREIINTDRRPTKNKLVRDHFEGFMKELNGSELAGATMKRYDISWRLHVEPFWGNVKENQINQDRFSDFIKWHRAEHGGKLFNHLKLMRGLIAYIRKSNPTLPLVDMSLPKKEADSNKESKGTFIELREIKGILKSKTLSHRERLMIRMAYNLGFRIGELTNLKIDRVKKVAGQVQIHLKAEDTKTRQARTVPLTDELGADIMALVHKSPSLYVFPMVTNFKRPVSKQVIDRAWLRAKESAGIRRRIRFHDLRHTAATNFADMGIDAVKACSILGMSLKIYMSVYVKRQSLNLSSVMDTLSKDGGIK